MKQPRTLIRNGHDKQSAIRSTLNRQLVRRRVFVLDQVFSSGNEIVEDILLLQFCPRLMPLLTVLAAATHVARSIDHALFKQGQSSRAECRRSNDIETAISIKQRRICSIQLNSRNLQ